MRYKFFAREKRKIQVYRIISVAVVWFRCHYNSFRATINTTAPENDNAVADFVQGLLALQRFDLITYMHRRWVQQKKEVSPTEKRTAIFFCYAIDLAAMHFAYCRSIGNHHHANNEN